ncbi:transport protein particle component [Aureobasidium pullulans]|nr:transport protein particle component [Aureobasidium pullulans]
MWRLDALGYRVGQGLVERFSANTPRPTTPLDMIKFICKDLWQLVFRKQIDNLKTNHRGTFVLTDNKFMALGRMSADTRRGPRGADEALGKAQPFLYFPCGIIRGALSGFGLNVTVHAESTELPQATFQIRTVGSKP